jgi:aerobic-type carbon monoxide dehydrogenase small subunit (CoxS/CutS family)
MVETYPIEVTVNGRRRAFEVAGHHSLLDVIRDDLGLTGTASSSRWRWTARS